MKSNSIQAGKTTVLRNLNGEVIAETTYTEERKNIIDKDGSVIGVIKETYQISKGVK